MKGIIFNLVEEVVANDHGPDAWDDILAAAGVEGAYTAVGSYSDDELLAIVSAAATATGASRTTSCAMSAAIRSRRWRSVTRSSSPCIVACAHSCRV